MKSEPSVEIFKTNVHEGLQAQELSGFLSQYFPGCRIVFDLEDCDKILKLEGPDLCAREVEKLVSEKGFFCEALP